MNAFRRLLDTGKDRLQNPTRDDAFGRLQQAFSRTMDHDCVDHFAGFAAQVVVAAVQVRQGTLSADAFLENNGLTGDVDFNFTADLVLTAYANLTDADPFKAREAARALRRAAANLEAKQSGNAIR